MTFDATLYSSDWDSDDVTVVDQTPLIVAFRAQPVYWDSKSHVNDTSTTATELAAIGGI